jgi:hypothetical protein
MLGWVLGGIVGLMLFAWFRAVNSIRQADQHYTIPRWRPAAVAVGLAVAGWFAALANGWLIAEALARQ